MGSKHLHLIFAAVTALIACDPSAIAQQTTGEPGSPGATTTIDGKQLPPADPAFGGVIKEKASESKPWWPPRVVPPKGAPNVLLIMTDDQGFGAPSTFGGVIPTPAMDRIANAGLALYELPFDLPVLTDTGGADHRPQPSLGRLRRGGRNIDGVPGVRTRSFQSKKAPSARFSRRTVTPRRGSAKTTTLPLFSRARLDRSINGRTEWALNIFMASSAATPASGNRTCSATRQRSTRSRIIPAGICRPLWRMTRSST